MKAVLISIQPKWCELIASGKKTVEVRKNRPKLDTPFKVYIYETQGKTETPFVDEEGHYIFKGRGQVIGEFVCNEIYWVAQAMSGIVVADMDWCVIDPNWFRDASCLTDEEICNYLNDNDGFGWLISDLVIYDKPKELSEFKRWKKFDWWDYGHHTNKPQWELCSLTRPPQSWCYVEKAGEG